MNNDLISREALKKELRQEVSGNRVGVFFAKRVFDIIDNAPTVNKCDNCDLMLLEKKHEVIKNEG